VAKPQRHQVLRDPVHRALVARINELMVARGWTLIRLADFSGIARGYLSNVLARQKSPTVRTLSKIAKALHVEVVDLLDPRRGQPVPRSR
jgi:transcriptional regulator with XRE-family HTH domain